MRLLELDLRGVEPPDDHERCGRGSCGPRRSSDVELEGSWPGPGSTRRSSAGRTGCSRGRTSPRRTSGAPSRTRRAAARPPRNGPRGCSPRAPPPVRGVVGRPASGGCAQPFQALLRGQVGRIQLRRPSRRQRGAFRVSLLLEDLPERALRLRRVGPQLDRHAGTWPPRRSRSPLSSAARPSATSRLAFWSRSSAATSSRPFWSSGRGFLLAAGPGQRQAQLIVRLPALRLEPRRLLELVDRFRDLAVPKQRLAERQVGPRERRGELDHLAELLDLLRPARGRGWRRRRPPG